MRKPFDASFRLINPDGTATQYFAEIIKDIQSRTLTKPVSNTEPSDGQTLIYSSADGNYAPAYALNKPLSATSPTNGQVLVYDSTAGLYKPGAN